MKGRFVLVLLGSLLFVGCDSEEKTKDEQTTDQIETKKQKTEEDIFTDLSEEGIRKKITEFLNRQEDHLVKNSSFQFYKGKMNRDEVEDWVVTVNTLDFAKKQLTEKENLGAIDYGYLGNYNHLFVIDGATGKWNGRPIGSSALVPLEVEIEFVNSVQYQVPIIYYRVGTSKFMAIYNSSIPSFAEIFKWQLFNLSDQKAAGQPTGNIVELKGDKNEKKKIEVYEADVIAFDEEVFVDNMFSYEAQLKKRNSTPIHVFEYQLAEGKFGEIKN